MSIDSILQQKAMRFSVRIVRLYQFWGKSHNEHVMSKQVLRSGTSIGANITEAIYGASRKDFLAKLQIAQKEAAETLYWLQLLHRCDYLTTDLYRSMEADCREILSILSASIKSTK